MCKENPKIFTDMTWPIHEFPPRSNWVSRKFLKSLPSLHSVLAAANYLNQLIEDGYLEKHKMGKENYYRNTRLLELLIRNGN